MTGRVVTAAAIIMIAVFGAFAIGNERALAMMGVGFAAAIFIDAFIIRLLLLPAVMHLAGPAMWWMPAWLDKRLPHLNIESEDQLHEPDEDAAPEREPAGVSYRLGHAAQPGGPPRVVRLDVVRLAGRADVHPGAGAVGVEPGRVGVDRDPAQRGCVVGDRGDERVQERPDVGVAVTAGGVRVDDLPPSASRSTLPPCRSAWSSTSSSRGAARSPGFQRAA